MSALSQLVKSPTCVEFSTIGEAIEGVLSTVHAGIVRQFLTADEAEKQAAAIEASSKPRGQLGRFLGTSLFDHKALPDYFLAAESVAAEIRSALGKEPEFWNAISSFEQLSLPQEPQRLRVRPVVHGGKPAAYCRGLAFDTKIGEAAIVKIHEDLAKVQSLSAQGFEIADTEIVLAHNLYLRNQTGEGSLYMYGRKFDLNEKRAIDSRHKGTTPDNEIHHGTVAEEGYFYPELELTGHVAAKLDVRPGDYVVFRADYPHKVGSDPAPQAEGRRISWNGFLSPLFGDPSSLVYWT
jgi:hypothetical protein